MDFERIDRNDYYPAASLGGFTYGTSTVEMASGFATLANDGVYREPTCIVKITDANGTELVSDHVNPVPVYEENAAREMTDILTGVLKYGTGRNLGLNNMSCAGKTGTTNDKKDGWFVGYTPYYTTSVWVGYDTPKTLSNLYGSSYPGYIWKLFMNNIHKDLEYKQFPGYISYEKPKKEEIEEEEEELEDDIDTKEEQDKTEILDKTKDPIEDDEGMDDIDDSVDEDPANKDSEDDEPVGEDPDTVGEPPDNVGEEPEEGN